MKINENRRDRIKKVKNKKFLKERTWTEPAIPLRHTENNIKAINFFS